MAKDPDQTAPRGRPSLIVRRSAIPVRRPPIDPAARPTLLDWPLWLQLIERKRRLVQRHQATVPACIHHAYFIQATCANFDLDGIGVTDQEATDALSSGPAKRKFRSRAAQRVRNHIAILHTIENCVRLGQPLKSAAVMRWYTSISSGLSTNALSEDRMQRLDQVARRINSPQLRLQPALQEIVRGYLDLLLDPLFPSFNGILSRLLVRYHLGRCGLPFVVLPPKHAGESTPSEVRLTLQLLTAIDDTYNTLLT